MPLPRALIVPAVLAVTPACSPEAPPPTTSQSSVPMFTTGSAQTSDSTASTAPTGATAAPTSTGATGTSSTTGGELPDCALWSADPEACSNNVACLYLANESVCITRCNYFNGDQSACEMQMYCYWAEGGCYLAV
ncbi:MAG: hypothetical protein JNL82_30305 [Myxococcales bacterium]|nr:hypothetical protein [Myxococcales bacterium]